MNDIVYIHGQGWFEAWLTYYINRQIDESKWYKV